MSIDIGLTHIALHATNTGRSVQFYSKYAKMHVVHERASDQGQVVWLSDKTRPFVIVLIPSEKPDPVLRPFAHLGVGCASRAEVDSLCAEATKDGCLVRKPTDSGYPVGYWALLSDPDGHTLEIAFGQEVGLTVAEARKGTEGSAPKLS